MGEWSIPADCKSALFGVRKFESYLPHQIFSTTLKGKTMKKINLRGPDGNAYALMGYAKKLGKKLGLTASAIDAIINEMMSGDYEHLVATFETHFGEHITLVR